MTKKTPVKKGRAHNRGPGPTFTTAGAVPGSSEVGWKTAYPQADPTNPRLHAGGHRRDDEDGPGRRRDVHGRRHEPGPGDVDGRGDARRFGDRLEYGISEPRSDEARDDAEQYETRARGRGGAHSRRLTRAEERRASAEVLPPHSCHSLPGAVGLEGGRGSTRGVAVHPRGGRRLTDREAIGYSNLQRPKLGKDSPPRHRDCWAYTRQGGRPIGRPPCIAAAGPGRGASPPGCYSLAHWSYLLPCTTFPRPSGRAGRFSLH